MHCISCVVPDGGLGIEDVNENYLFHGTNPESAQCIARDFFRMERAGSSAGSMFGPGIYLAENASKSDESPGVLLFFF